MSHSTKTRITHQDALAARRAAARAALAAWAPDLVATMDRHTEAVEAVIREIERRRMEQQDAEDEACGECDNE